MFKRVTNITRSMSLSSRQALATNGLLLLLVVTPLLIISALSIHSLKTEATIAARDFESSLVWVSDSVDRGIQQSLTAKTDHFFFAATNLLDEQSDLRGWSLGQTSVDMITTYTLGGERTFPLTEQNILVNELSLLQEIHTDITYMFKQVDLSRGYSALIPSNSGPKLLACRAHRQQVVCILFSSRAVLDWVSAALAATVIPGQFSASLSIPRLADLPFNAPHRDDKKDFHDATLLATHPMSGTYSTWRIMLYGEPPSGTPNLRLLYSALLLPLFLIIIGSGYGLYRMDRVKRKQALNQKLFSAELAHEIRTPLANIRLYTDLIRDSSASKSDDYREILVCEIERLSRLVDNAILLARPEETATDHYCQFADPDEVIATTLQTLQPSVDDNQCALESELGCPISGDFDVDALQRILINLVDNACKYAQCCEIRISSRLENNTISIQISDDGPGFPDTLWSSINDAHVSRTNTGKRGFGLGLRVCSRLARRSGGKLEKLPSAPGATFHLWLPITQRQTAAC